MLHLERTQPTRWLHLERRGGLSKANESLSVPKHYILYSINDAPLGRRADCAEERVGNVRVSSNHSVLILPNETNHGLNGHAGGRDQHHRISDSKQWRFHVHPSGRTGQGLHSRCKHALPRRKRNHCGTYNQNWRAPSPRGRHCCRAGMTKRGGTGRRRRPGRRRRARGTGADVRLGSRAGTAAAAAARRRVGTAATLDGSRAPSDPPRHACPRSAMDHILD